MLKRKIFNSLHSWKVSHGTECLLINGARQVGKSFTIETFGRSEYESLIKIDFVKQPELKSIFEGSLAPEDIYSRITLAIPGARLIPGSTLIFLDEIQECPEARSAFKYLAQYGGYDVIGSGSLLGIRFRELKNAPSLPVGYERQITMHPLDFEEFLWARGYSEEALAALRGYLERMEPVPQAIHQPMMRQLREYLTVGGMPATVQAFISGGGGADFAAAHNLQLMLHEAYLDDIARYASAPERVKARACYLSLPRQLAKENTRFKYAEVEKRSSARKFEGSVDWLTCANMTLRCNAVSTPTFPLASYEDGSRFRLYANDTGMLMAMFDFSMKAAVVNNTLTGPMKGGLYENLVASMLAQRETPLRYWMSSNNKHEIEFLAEEDVAVVPMEVKASRGATASLNAILARDDIRKGYKLIDGNIGKDGKKRTLPLYMAAFL
jgi:uncharacterized protein